MPGVCNILVIGHSHVSAIREAAVARRAAAGAPTVAVRTIHVLDPAHGGEFAPDAPGSRLSDGLLAVLEDQIARHHPLIASVLCGNMHSVLSLVEEDEPFDFPLSGEPSPKLNPRATLRPEGEVRDWLAAAMRVDLDRITLLRDAVGPFVQIESPPPVAARSFIARHIEPVFAAMPHYPRNGIAPGGVRYRMWRLSSRILAAHCRALGCGYLPCPAAARDENGFLARAFAGNATHANSLYGEEVIRLLEPMASARTG